MNIKKIFANKKVILFSIFAAVLLLILLTNSKQSLLIGPKQAVESVKSLPDVKDYLERVPNGKIELGGEDPENYNIQVYEIKDGHTATFNWYYINKSTGEIKKEFEF